MLMLRCSLPLRCLRFSHAPAFECRFRAMPLRCFRYAFRHMLIFRRHAATIDAMLISLLLMPSPLLILIIFITCCHYLLSLLLDYHFL